MGEDTFFRTRNFKYLPKETVGIDVLRWWLSVLLFDHVKKEPPKLREDLGPHLTGRKNSLRCSAVRDGLFQTARHTWHNSVSTSTKFPRQR
jgi:hypothetical protein